MCASPERSRGFREQLYPTHTFLLAYDAMCGWKGERADVDYVRILHLAATTMECEVERALRRLLESSVRRLPGGEAAGRAGVSGDALELSGEVDTTGCLREVRDDD